MNQRIKDILRKVLPARAIRGLAGFKADLFDEYGRRSYAQDGEDLILAEMFQDVQRGFYVDVGAYHPARYSNTCYFYRRGWRGINIDARPGSMAAFRRCRPRDINIEAAVSKQPALQTYFMFEEGAFNTLDRSVAEQRMRESGQTCRQQPLAAVPLADLLREYAPPRQTIHFLSVDVEGKELEVLESNDWNVWRPRCVLVECLAVTLAELPQDPRYVFLTRLGYEAFARTSRTTLFRQTA